MYVNGVKKSESGVKKRMQTTNTCLPITYIFSPFMYKKHIKQRLKAPKQKLNIEKHKLNINLNFKLHSHQ